MELLGNAFKDTISDINKGITIIPKSVLVFAEDAQFGEAIDISSYLNKLNSMINGLNVIVHINYSYGLISLSSLSIIRR